MKRFASILLLVVLFLTPVYPQTPFDGCPPEGKRKKTPSNPTGKVPEREAAMNRMKNRDDITGPIDRSITIQSLIKAKEETDLDATRPVEIIGFVADVIAGTPRETCNCARSDIEEIHIDIADRNNKLKYVIVEMTPRFKAKLGDLKTIDKAITGKWVKFTGWLTSTISTGTTPGTYRRKETSGEPLLGRFTL